jgi:hypothetical protein
MPLINWAIHMIQWQLQKVAGIYNLANLLKIALVRIVI